MKPTVYRHFAENLMASTVQRGSIAEVCRQTEINRQQFNKYLAGASPPSETTLQKLADYFGVPDHALFEQVGRAEDAKLIFQAIDVASSTCELDFGIYAVFAPWIADPKSFARSTLLLYHRHAASD
jgi:transcriptional regulator with XRE-family HTH domain